MDKPGLLNIKKLKPIAKELNSIEGQMLTRIYAIYPKNKDGKPSKLSYRCQLDCKMSSQLFGGCK